MKTLDTETAVSSEEFAELARRSTNLADTAIKRSLADETDVAELMAQSTEVADVAQRSLENLPLQKAADRILEVAQLSDPSIYEPTSETWAEQVGGPRSEGALAQAGRNTSEHVSEILRRESGDKTFADTAIRRAADRNTGPMQVQ